MWDLKSLTRDRTHTTYIGKLSLNHWPPREVPPYFLFCATETLILFRANMLQAVDYAGCKLVFFKLWTQSITRL